MEKQVYRYFFEVRGKAPRKRKFDKVTLDLGVFELDVSQPTHDPQACLDKLPEVRTWRDATWSLIRTVVAEHKYGDGKVMYFVPLFDVNLTRIATGSVKAK